VIKIHGKAVLLEQGFAENVRLSLNDGQITQIEMNTPPQADDECFDFVLPGLDNVHSHSFQRVMSGLAERRGSGQDSFWSWRRLMYAQALALEPDEMEAVAAWAFMEMLEGGFTRVGEFHYLHHDRQGQPYAKISRMAHHIAAAAQATGIGLTLLPVFYAHSGFGGTPPHQEQCRFINSLDSFAKLWQECAELMAALPTGKLGLAAHSLRAVSEGELHQLLPLAAGRPVHIHIAEQVKEVEDCLAWVGLRPVEWLLENMPVDKKWTLVHATHIEEKEGAAIARRGAVAGLCPVTEANLGDGTFPAHAFLGSGGHFAIGSDSNIVISAVQELRQLEYSQRLKRLGRNILARSGQSTGVRLYDESLRGGAKSIAGNGHFKAGAQADFITLRAEPWVDCSYDTILDQWIFGTGVDIDCVFVAGKKQVEAGRHIHRADFAARFTNVMRTLRDEDKR